MIWAGWSSEEARSDVGETLVRLGQQIADLCASNAQTSEYNRVNSEAGLIRAL